VNTLQAQRVSSEEGYRPSGWVSLGRFLPLFLLGLIIACLMAFVLCLLENNWYFFIITPFIVSVPVFGALLLAIRVGRCRNRVAGAIVGLLLLGLYYGGYWTMSYLLNVVSQGPEAVEYVRQEGGAPGVLGYFRFRCRKAVIKSTEDFGQRERHSDKGDPFGAYLFYGMEIVLILGAGFLAGKNSAGRVFYENAGQWASSMELRFAGGEFATAYRAAQAQDWGPLAKLSRLPRLGGNAASSLVTMKIEYLKGATDEPVYVTISGSNLGKNPAARAAGAKGWGSISKTFIRQRMVSGAAVQSLAQVVPEFAAVATPAAIQQAAAGPTIHTQRPSPLRAALEKAGVIARKTDGSDFRETAVKASAALLSGSVRALNLADLNRSLCLVAEPNAAARVKSEGRFELKLIGCAAVLLVGGALIGALGEGSGDKSALHPVPGNLAVETVGWTLFSIGLAAFLGALIAGSTVRKRMLMGRLCRRPGALFGAETKERTMLLRVEDARTFQFMKSAPEDIGVCLFDEPRRRLLIEGISHRYVICGADVTKLALLSSGRTTTIQVDYRVGNEELALALGPMGLGRHVAAHSPLFLWLAKRSADKLTQRFRKVLNVAA